MRPYTLHVKPRYFAPAIAIIIALTIFAISKIMSGTPARAAVLFDGGSDQARITSAIKRDEPSVVALEVYVGGTQYVPVDPFGDTAPQAVQGRASGSGFVYDSNGTIVTNAHVISPPTGGHVEKIEVVFANGDRVPGHVAAVNRSADLALVRVDGYAKLPPPLPLADSKNVIAGQWAIAIGEPLELRQTVTVGVVSGFDRSEPIADDNGAQRVFTGLLQTSAPINPGNSGGPLIDMSGRVIGINQSVASGAQGIGFAIPVDTIHADVTAMLGEPSTTTADAGNAASSAPASNTTAFVGVALAPLDAMRSQIAYAGQHGVAVQAVTASGPADTSGIQPGDVIVSVDGTNVDSPQAAAAAIHAHKPGDTIHMQVASGTAERSVDVVASTTPQSAPQVGLNAPQMGSDSQQNGDAQSDGSTDSGNAATP